MVVIGQIGGAFVGGVLADAIGRKKSTVLLAVGYAAFALLDAFSVSMPMLLTARLLIGVTIGVSVVVVPVYVAGIGAGRDARIVGDRLSTRDRRRHHPWLPGGLPACRHAQLATGSSGWPPYSPQCCCRC